MFATIGRGISKARPSADSNTHFDFSAALAKEKTPCFGRTTQWPAKTGVLRSQITTLERRHASKKLRKIEVFCLFRRMSSEPAVLNLHSAGIKPHSRRMRGKPGELREFGEFGELGEFGEPREVGELTELRAWKTGSCPRLLGTTTFLYSCYYCVDLTRE